MREHASEARKSVSHDSIESETTTRRKFIAGAAAVAAARWEREDYDPENIDEWDPIEPATYPVAELNPDTIFAGMYDEEMDVWEELDTGDFEDIQVKVHYDQSGPNLEIAADSADGEIHHGSLVELTPEQMFDLAGALYQAAWEYENNEVSERDI